MTSLDSGFGKGGPRARLEIMTQGSEKSGIDREGDSTPSPAGRSLPRPWMLALSVLVLGSLVGLSSGLLALFFEWAQGTVLGFVESPGVSTPFRVPAPRRIVSVLIGGLVAALVWWFLRNHTRKVPSVDQAVKGADMPCWQTVLHVLTQIFLVAAGGSIGREVAPREAGAMLGGLWWRVAPRLGLHRDDRSLLVAAAAGAGFAGIYTAPLTGTFFGIEVLLTRIDMTAVMVTLAMSCLATLVGGSVKGFDPYYLVGHDSFSPWFMAFVLLAGPVMGLAGAGFRRLTAWAQNHRTTGPAILWQLTGVALLTGLVAIWMPEVMGNGRALAQTGMSQKIVSAGSPASLLAPVATLLVMALAKAVLTAATIGAGASGGTLTPSIALGSSLGAAMGLVIVWWFPGLPLWQCAVLGAAALLAASQQAPLMAMAMVMEVCRLPVGAFMPLGLAVVLSVAVSRVLLTGRRS